MIYATVDRFGCAFTRQSSRHRPHCSSNHAANRSAHRHSDSGSGHSAGCRASARTQWVSARGAGEGVAV
ncbi:MAG: hypothetical protein IPL59_21290 [Candidatus Competibacteraceae bacterium]|nr:hypothetical protein [Candidatus Competibacteraceae bacterium]